MPKNINKLGERVDGWADIVLGAGDEAELARRQLEVIIKRKSFPGTLVSTEMISPSSGGKSRSYILAEMNNGATLTAYFGSFGKDMYAKWDIYVKEIVNTGVVYSILGLAGLQGLFFGIVLNSILNNALVFIIGWVLGTVINLIPLLIIVGFISLLVKKSFLGLFYNERDEFDIDDIAALTLAIDKAMRDTLDAIGIETKALRMKEHFSAGKRERII